MHRFGPPFSDLGNFLWHNSSTRLTFVFATCGFVWLVMAVFIWLQPYMTDNFIFSRHMIPGYAALMSGKPIESMGPMTLHAAFSQAFELYFTWCGRFMGNLFVYLLFMLPKAAYVCFAASCCIVYLFLLHMLISGQNWRKDLCPQRLLGLAALVWVGLPSFGSAFLWLSIGGYIALIGQALFLLPYRFAIENHKIATKASFWKCGAFFLFGMIVASLDYPSCVALPVASVLCTVFLYFRQLPKLRKFPKLSFWGACGVSFGAMLTLMAPGNAMRMAITTDPEIHAWISLNWGERILSWLLHLPEAFGLMLIPLILLVWASCVLYKQHGKGFVLQFSPVVLLFLFPAMATVGSYMFTSWPPSRAFNTVAGQLIIAGMVLVDNALPLANRKMLCWYGVLRIFLCVICIFSVVQTSIKLWEVHKASDVRETIFFTHKGGDVQIPPMPVRGDSHMVLGSHLMDITPKSSHWLNRAVAAFYGVRSVTLITPPLKIFKLSQKSQDANVQATICGNRIDANYHLRGQEMVESLHFYYFGVSALLYKAPEFLCNKILFWLSQGKEGDLRLLLVPLLLARADVQLARNSSEDGQGSNTLWGIQHGYGLWIVRPGKGMTSFDILPLVSLK